MTRIFLSNGSYSLETRTTHRIITSINSCKETTAIATSKLTYLTRPFHHDRGRIVFAVSPRRGEQAALARPSGQVQ
jgi:hypothetical protein